MKQIRTTYLDQGQIPYVDALSNQQDIRKNIIALKYQSADTCMDNVLILCEHPPILTFGSSAKDSELFISKEELSDVGLDHIDIKRGGAITFHGDGQIVGYPVLDLYNFRTDIRWYIRSLTEVVIRTLNDYGVKSYYDEEFPGVWIDDNLTGMKKKICAVGVHLSRWVTNHGFAFNINNSLEYYKYFIPCGIAEAGRTVTNLERELNRALDIEEVKEKIVFHFSIVFNTEISYTK